MTRSSSSHDGFRSTLTFSYNLVRILVFPESEENWLPQFQITRPLCEFDLADEFWIDPGVLSHFAWRNPLDPFAASLRWQISKRTAVAFFGLEFFINRRERFRIDASTHLTGAEQAASGRTTVHEPPH